MYSVIAAAAAALQQPQQPPPPPQQQQHHQQQQQRAPPAGNAVRAGSAGLNADELQWLSYTFDITSLTSPESKAGADVFLFPERAPDVSPECSDDGVPTRPQALGGVGGGGSGTKRVPIERKRSSDGAGFRESLRPAKLLSPTSNAPPHRSMMEEIVSPLTGTPHSCSGTSSSGASVEIKAESLFAPSHYYGELSPTYFVPDAAAQLRSRWGKRPLAVDTGMHSGLLPAAYQHPALAHREAGVGPLSMQQLHEHGRSPLLAVVKSEPAGTSCNAAADGDDGGGDRNSSSNNNNQGEDEFGAARHRDGDVDYEIEDDSTVGSTPRDPRARSRSVSMGQHDSGLLSPGQLSSSWSGPMSGMAFFAGPEHHHRHQHSDALPTNSGDWLRSRAPGADGAGPGGALAGVPSPSTAAASKLARTPRRRCGSSASTSSNASCGSGGSATALFSPDSAAAAARRKVKAPGDEGCMQGRWKAEEVAVLLLIAELYYSGELKMIGDVCRFCGLNRPSRAIDKQLKRLLAYDKWSSRDDVVLQQLRFLRDDPRHKLGHDNEIAVRLAEAATLWPVPQESDRKLKVKEATDEFGDEIFEEDDS